MIPILDAIIQRLQANEQLFLNEGLEPIRHFDVDAGQNQYPEQFELFQTPAILYNYRADWTSSVSRNNQIGEVTIEIKIIIENVGSSAVSAPDRADTLKIMKYQELVNSCLHGLSGSSFTALRRKSDDPQISADILHTHIITYTSNVTDYSTDRYKAYVLTEIEELELYVKPPEDHEGSFIIET